MVARYVESMTPTTDVLVDLDAIRSRASAATKGPWFWRGNIDYRDPYLTSAGIVGDVMAVLPTELTRDDALRLGVGDPDYYDYDIKVPDDVDDPAAYYDVEFNRIRDEYIAEWLIDNYGEPRKECRLTFTRNGWHQEARRSVVFEVDRSAESRDDKSVYRADIVGLRFPNAEFIAHARQDIDDLLAEVDRLNSIIGESVHA